MKKAKNWKKRLYKHYEKYEAPKVIGGFQSFVAETQVESAVADMDTPEINDIKMEDLQISSDKTGKLEVEAEHIKVILPIDIYYQMMAYTKLLDDEINGIGMVEKVDRATFRVTELFLLDQTVSKAACTIEPDAIVKLMMQLEKDGKNPSMLRFWWHSHNTMGAFWSATDENTGKMFGGSEYLISLVSTHSGDMRAKINLYAPVELFVDNIKIIIEQPCAAPDLLEKCKAEIIEKVKTEKTYFQSQYPQYQTNLVVTPGEAKKEEKGSESSGIEHSLFTGEFGGWGDSFVDNDVRVVWNRETKRYEGFDVHTNAKLEDDDFRMRTDLDYNDESNAPYAYGDYSHLRVE